MKNFVNISWVLIICFYAAISQSLPVEYQKHHLHNQKIAHVIMLDPSKVSIEVLSMQPAIQNSNLITIAKERNAIVAINGGFFSITEDDRFVPAGVLKINKIWHGIAYAPRAAIGWSNDLSTVYIDRVQTRTKLEIQAQTYNISAMNQKFNTKSGKVLYSSCFGKQITLDKPAFGLNIVDGKILSVGNKDRFMLPNNSNLYLLGSDHPVPSCKQGDEAKIIINPFPQEAMQSYPHWQNLDNIVGGAPLLIHNGKKMLNYQNERLSKVFLNEVTARTAVGMLDNKHLVFVFIEHPMYKTSAGITIKELANFMYSLGCTYAMNLDGGNSSTMYFRDQYIPDFPTRPVANGFLVFENDPKY